MKLRLLRQYMMGTWNLNRIRRLLIVLISQNGGKLCVLSFLTWNISKFGKSLQNQTYLTGRKIIGSRWVLARKDDGCYRARCVAKGFLVKYQEKTFKKITHLLYQIRHYTYLWSSKQYLSQKLDNLILSQRFLHGTLDEDLWMAIPDGYDKYLKEKHKKDIDTTTHCLKLTKAIYG
jgi:Reverse transcriptase (RNA-dependent DNA polymerase)